MAGGGGGGGRDRAFCQRVSSSCLLSLKIFADVPKNATVPTEELHKNRTRRSK